MTDCIILTTVCASAIQLAVETIDCKKQFSPLFAPSFNQLVVELF